MPEIVIREAVGAYRRALAGPIRELENLGIVHEPSGLLDAYENDLRGTLETSGAVILVEPTISLLDLADRAINRVRPFNEQGNGFRDSIIWSYVLDAVRSGEDVIFVSADSAFSQGNGDDRVLHPELASEAHSSGNLAWFPVLGAYLASRGHDAANTTIEGAILKLVAEERREIEQRLSQAVERATASVPTFDEVSVRVESVGRPIEITKTTVLAHPRALHVFLVTFEFTAPIVIEATWSQGGRDSSEGGIQIPTVPLAVEALFNSDTGELLNFGAGTVQLDAGDIAESTARARLARREVARLREIQSMTNELGRELGDGAAIEALLSTLVMPDNLTRITPRFDSAVLREAIDRYRDTLREALEQSGSPTGASDAEEAPPPEHDAPETHDPEQGGDETSASS